MKDETLKKADSFAIEDFEIEELEDRLEMLLFSDVNCSCKPQAK